MSAPKHTAGLALELGEVKRFLRVDHYGHDFHIACLAERAVKRIEADTGVGLTPMSPAPLRLAALMLVLRAYERDDDTMPIGPVESWVKPYRTNKATGASQ